MCYCGESVVPVTSGVPQGTVLGLLPFLIYVNDLTESITSSVKLFSDDCLVYHTIHSSNDAIQLQVDLVQLGLWVNSWKMSLDPHICSTMHIFYKRNTVCAKHTINGFHYFVSLEISILVYPSALRCPGATTLTIFVIKNH